MLKRLILRHLAPLGHQLVLVAVVASTAGAETVTLQLQGSINLRVRDQIEEQAYLRQIDTLPRGTVIEVDSAALAQPDFLPYTNQRLNSRYGFVRGIKVISLPGGDTPKNRARITQLNSRTLFISKGNLNTHSQKISSSQARQTRQLEKSAPAYNAELAVDPSSLQTSVGQMADVLSQTRNLGNPGCSNCTETSASDSAAQPRLGDDHDYDGPTTPVRRIHPDMERSAPGLQKTIDRFAQLAQNTPGLTREAYSQALRCLQTNGDQIKNRDVITIADYHLPSRVPRLFVFDLVKGTVTKEWVAHGSNSGGDRATKFSNGTGDHTTSLGCYRTGQVYDGKHGESMRLVGLSEGFNTAAMERGIVFHGARYVDPQLAREWGRLGRSQGCPAVRRGYIGEFIADTKGGSLFLAAGPGFS